MTYRFKMLNPKTGKIENYFAKVNSEGLFIKFWDENGEFVTCELPIKIFVK